MSSNRRRVARQQLPGDADEFGSDLGWFDDLDLGAPPGEVLCDHER
jgi:hypothetical protein